MTEFGRYIISVVTAAMIVCIFCSFFDRKDVIGSLIRMIGGLFLTAVVLSPVVRMDYSATRSYFRSFETDGAFLAEKGSDLSSEAMTDIIKERTEAYILDKASGFQSDLSVNVTVGNEYPYAPESVDLTGRISPYGKKRLESIMERDLGIPKERQRWIG